MMEQLWLFILLALLSEILGTIGGFGSSLFFVPIASYFLDFHSVLGVTAVFHVSSNLTKIAFFRKGLDKKLVFNFGIPAVIFVTAGAYLGKFIDTKILEIILGILLVIMSIVMYIYRNQSMRQSIFNTFSGGVLSGLASGLLGTGGAIRGIFLAAYDLKMEAFIATSAIIDLFIDISRSVVYFANGYVHKNDMYLIPILLVVSIVGTFIGKIVLKFISEKQFRIIVICFILFTGIITIRKFILQN